MDKGTKLVLGGDGIYRPEGYATDSKKEESEMADEKPAAKKEPPKKEKETMPKWVKIGLWVLAALMIGPILVLWGQYGLASVACAVTKSENACDLQQRMSDKIVNQVASPSPRTTSQDPRRTTYTPPVNTLTDVNGRKWEDLGKNDVSCAGKPRGVTFRCNSQTGFCLCPQK